MPKKKFQKKFADFGEDAQDMLIAQLQAIDLEKIGPKSIAHVGKTLIGLIKTSNQLQEECEDLIRENWITIREMSHIILTEVLDRFKVLSEEGAIPEWERANVMALLNDITKVCHAESKQDALAEVNTGKVLDKHLLDEMLGIGEFAGAEL